MSSKHITPDLLTSVVMSASDNLAPSTTNASLLDEQAVADYLKCSIAMVRKWRYASEGPAVVNLGRLVRYRLADVEKFVEDSIKR